MWEASKSLANEQIIHLHSEELLRQTYWGKKSRDRNIRLFIGMFSGCVTLANFALVLVEHTGIRYCQTTNPSSCSKMCPFVSRVLVFSFLLLYSSRPITIWMPCFTGFVIVIFILMLGYFSAYLRVRRLAVDTKNAGCRLVCSPVFTPTTPALIRVLSNTFIC